MPFRSRLSTFCLVSALTAFALLQSSTADALWHLYSNDARSYPGATYYGFAHSLQSTPYFLTSYNSSDCVQDACNSCSSIGLFDLYYSAVTQTGTFQSPSSSYWDWNGKANGKVLYRPSPGFLNPANGQSYPFVMFYASQQIGSGTDTCSNNGLGSAYSGDGITFVEGQQASALMPICNPSLTPPTTCSSADFFCNEWPCDTQSPKYSWTDCEIFSPLIYTDGNLYAAAFLYQSGQNTNNFSDCTYPNSLCYPSNPLHAGTATYILESADGISWVRWNLVNSEDGRISANGIDTTSPCYHAAWLINVDLAYSPATDDFYLTRSYASSGTPGCNPGSLPDRFQLYKVHGSSGVTNGPWQLLYDGGCAELGFAVDSATFVHDGLGNVVIGQNGSIALTLNASGSTVCGGHQAPNATYVAVIGP